MGGSGAYSSEILTNSSEGHLSKKDVRSQTEISVPVVKMNLVREGKWKPPRFVWRLCKSRLVRFGNCPPKMIGSSMSISVILESLASSRCLNCGAATAEKTLNKRSN